MNYLSHYRYEAYGLNAHEVAGLVLADLSRLRGRGFRLKPVMGPLLLAAADINKGVIKHLAADAAWHGGTGLTQIQNAIEAYLEAAIQPIPRRYFFAHIAAELLLDRYLLEQEPQLVKDFYKTLDAVKPEEVIELIQKSDHPELAGAVATEFQRFKQVRFLEKYVDDGHLLAILKGIYRGVVKTDLPFAESQTGSLYREIKPVLAQVAAEIFKPWPV